MQTNQAMHLAYLMTLLCCLCKTIQAYSYKALEVVLSFTVACNTVLCVLRQQRSEKSNLM